MPNEHSISIKIESFPSISDFATPEVSHADVTLYLTQECDSYIDLVINGHNVLNGYVGAYVYPLYAFLKSLNDGLATALSSGTASVPIYLQQYSFSEDSPHHTLGVRLTPEKDIVLLDFSWCMTIARPPGVPWVCDSAVSIGTFLSELEKRIIEFKYAATTLLAAFDKSPEKKVAKLFAEFSPIRILHIRRGSFD